MTTTLTLNRKRQTTNMYPLQNANDLSVIIDDIANRSVVLLGEASHGTHEYYTWRTALSKRLIEEKQFQFIAVEGDWPDCYQINRYVKGYEDAGTGIREVLEQFDRWPTWMWANWEIAALAEWLKEFNQSLPKERKVGFYGLDVYSLWDSMKAIMNYLQTADAQAAQYVKQAIACFEPFRENEQQYARHSMTKHCRDEVVALLRALRLRSSVGNGDMEAGFNAEQNALIAVNAERYYRSMMGWDNESWNIRDRHMMHTLQRLLQLHGKAAKGIVWEHNTHIGDARATDMHRAGMVNLGQLAREEWGNNRVYLTGFSGYKGAVIAGEEWGAPMQEMEVPEARADSIEGWLHNEYRRNGLIIFNQQDEQKYDQKTGHRAIGVVYNPAREWPGNYVPSVMAERYDALLYLDDTSALHPLHLHPHNKKLPETYPFGL